MSSNALNSTFTPTEQVFNTTELLEHILSSLPMPKVLGKSRVSRNWKAVIDKSPALQKKLLLGHHDNQAEDYPQNLSIDQTDLLISLINKPVYTTKIVLNPLVDWENQAGLHVTHEMTATRPKPFHPSLTGIGIILGKLNRAYVRPLFSEASQTPQSISSWRNMYLTLPPITEVVFAMPTAVGRSYEYDTNEYDQITVYAEHGITLGLLHDRLEHQMKRFCIKDVDFRVQRIKEGHPKGKQFAKRWGKKEHPMFLVQRAEGATDLVSQ
ncbi:hypothetical protein MBLNU13_g04078t2 [Cladosporium sp. NU13]